MFKEEPNPWDAPGAVSPPVRYHQRQPKLKTPPPSPPATQTAPAQPVADLEATEKLMKSPFHKKRKLEDDYLDSTTDVVAPPPSARGTEAVKTPLLATVDHDINYVKEMARQISLYNEVKGRWLRRQVLFSGGKATWPAQVKRTLQAHADEIASTMTSLTISNAALKRSGDATEEEINVVSRAEERFRARHDKLTQRLKTMKFA